MQIAANELKLNMRKYLEMAAERDIFITENGWCIARLTSPPLNRVAILDSLVGIAKAENITLDDIKWEHLEKQY